MGMYNELNNISRAVNGQALELKKTQQQQKQAEYIKSELKSMLQNELIDLNNIFSDEAKSIAIENVLNNTTTLLYNRNFTRQFLNDKYYVVARQVEQIKKRTEATSKPDYRGRIAIEKWDIQRQKELLKIKQLEQKIAQNEQKYNMRQTQKCTIRQVQPCYAPQGAVVIEIIKAFMFIMFAPIAVFGLIIYGFISAAAKTK